MATITLEPTTNEIAINFFKNLGFEAFEYKNNIVIVIINEIKYAVLVKRGKSFHFRTKELVRAVATKLKVALLMVTENNEFILFQHLPMESDI